MVWHPRQDWVVLLTSAARLIAGQLRARLRRIALMRTVLH